MTSASATTTQLVGMSYKFTGKERDSESGLDNFGFRYNSSSLGRFMSPDPVMASGRVENPQTWNRYTYVLNNPLRFIDPLGLFASPAYNCTETNQNCLNDEQRRILENSTVEINGQELSGEALYNKLSEAQKNAFVNTTDKLASIQLGDGSTALSQVESVSGIGPDRIFANVSDTLATSLQNSSGFTTVPGHEGFNAISFKETGVTFGNIQLSFNESRRAADIDIDIGNIAAKNPFKKLVGAIVHGAEVLQNKITDTKTNQDTIRKILIQNPKVAITPSPDPKFNKP